MNMSDRDDTLKTDTHQGEPRWSYASAMLSVFVVAEQRRSSSLAKEFKGYITNFFNESDPRYSEQIRHDVLAFRRVNQYLKSVDPDIGIATALDMVVWLKLAYDYWASFGVNDRNGRVDPDLLAYRRAFQDKYLRYRGERGHRSRLALVVPDDVFRRLENGELDIDAVEKLDECYALDVFLLCHLEEGWWSRRWRIWYVEPQLVSQALFDPAIPEQLHSVKTKKRGARFKKGRELQNSLGPENFRKMGRALAEAVDHGGFGGLLEAPKYSGDQYRFNGTRIELYKKLKNDFDITESKWSGLKLISFYVLCRVWS